jgi:hypothetical protein
MRRLLPLALLLVGAGGAAPPPVTAVPAAQREMNERMAKLRGEIDELMGRYETLVKQSAAIEQLLARLGFSAQMSVDTVAQRVELMRRFEQAEAARTAAYEKLKGLLKTIAEQHHLETSVEVRNGHIVVHLAETALFDAKRGTLRAEVNPLLWAVAEGLKDLPGRHFQVVTEVSLPAAHAPAPTATGKGKARAKPGKRLKLPAVEDPWATAAQRAAEVVRALEVAGVAPERLAAVQRLPDPAAARPRAGRFLDIIVLPTRDELPRVHGAADTALALPPPPEKPPLAPAPPAPPPAAKAPPARVPAPAGR